MDFIELNIWAVCTDDDDWVWLEDYLPWVVSTKSIQAFIGTTLDFKVCSIDEKRQEMSAVQIFFDKETSLILKSTRNEKEENFYVAESYESLCERIKNNVFGAPKLDY